MKRGLWLWLVMVLMFFSALLACGGGTSSLLNSISSINVTAASPSIGVGDTDQFTATGKIVGNTGDITKQVTWTSSNPSVATIDSSGLATGVAVGTCTIKATLAGVSGSMTLTVSSSSSSSNQFAQSDLQGTWNWMNFTAGPDVTAGTVAGWERGNITIDGSGKITFNSYTNNLGGTGGPTNTMVLTLNPSIGVITQTSNGQSNDFHGQLASNKNIFVAVVTVGNGNDREIAIAIKQNGTTFSSADISSVNFVDHEINSGSNDVWWYEAGSINSSQQVSVSSCSESSGTCTPPGTNFTTLSITSTGIVSSSSDGTPFQGVMTPDKKNIFITNGDGINHPTKLIVLQVTGQTFALSDLAGTWYGYMIASSPTSPVWAYSTWSFDNTGDLTNQSFVSNDVSQSPGSGPATASVTVSMNSAGTITPASGSSVMNGAMSYNKDMIIITDTISSGQASLDIFLK